MYRSGNRRFTSLLAIVLSFVGLLGFLATNQSALAQSSNGQITGLVTDSTGAAMLEADVAATNTATGVSTTTRTNSSGVYVLPQLLPGSYEVKVTKTGFGTSSRKDLIVRTGDKLSLNFTLKPGSVQETVNVNATALLNADQSASAQVLDNKMITELPQLNRNTLDLAGVIPAIQGQGPPADQISTLGNATYFIANSGNSYSVAGGQVNGTNISVDGNQVQDQEFNATNRSVPTPDEVGEFRVESGILTADHGRYSGGVISVNTQSGTNRYHGRLFEYFRNQILNANQWAQNAVTPTVPRQAFHQNDYGLTFGGPVSIPHVYSGKDRTFFFFGWEGERFNQSQNVVSSVPTLLNRQGDFSQTVINYQNGLPVYATIFDPFHGSNVGGNWVRPQYAQAKICSQADITGGTCPAGNESLSLQSALFSNYMSLWPLPNHAPAANSDHVGNYYSTIHTTRPTDRFFLRLDENVANNQRVNFSISRSNMTNSIPAPYFHGSGSVTTDLDWTGSLQYNWTLSPTSILDAHIGFGVADLVSDGVSGWGSSPDPKIDTSKWPFDPLIINNPAKSTVNIPPGISICGFDCVGGYDKVGGAEFDSFINQNVNGSIAYTKVFHRHTIKTGFDLYFLRFREKGGDRTGVAWVNPGGGSNQDWNNVDNLTGSPLAELMMGSSNVFQWGNWNITPYGWNQAAYVMDDWKVNNKLTVQMGLRWDHDGARKPQNTNASTPIMYDMNAKNVLTPNAGWNWGQVTAAVPGLANLPQPAWLSQGATGRVALLGTPEYPQKNLYSTEKLNFQPRLGIAYALNDNTVLHGSTGIIYQGLGGLSTDWFSFYYNSVTFNQIATLDGQNWVSEFGRDHGLGTFPTQSGGTNLGYYPPIRTNQEYGFQTFGAAASLDQGGTTISHFQSPEEYSWDFSVQHQLAKNWVATVDYTGIRGIHLLMPVWNWSTNNIPLQYYKLGNNLSTQVPNPFFGQSQTFASEPTVSLSQLLGLSPQYSQVSPGQATWGRSFSNFLNMQVQGRNYHGLTLLASYSIRKTLTNTAGKDIQHNGPAGRGLLQDPHNLMEAYGVALYEMPQTMLLNYSYELPFGNGRSFMNHGNGIGYKVLDTAIGGWSVAGISTYNPKGTPVLVPDVSTGTTVPGAALRYSLAPGVNARRSNAEYSQALAFNGGFVKGSAGEGVLNPAAFVTTPDYGLSNAPFVFPNLRNPGSFFTDATLLKKFYFSREADRYVELRVEALNIFNHANYGPIDNNPNSSTFGAVQGKGINLQQGFNLNNPPRTMQIGLRIFF
jgi:Carboxypeptidase regulatory-like domain